MLVKDVMTREVITISPGATLKEAGNIMREKRISGIPVMEGEELVGMITVTDVMRFILDNIYQVKIIEEELPKFLTDMVEHEKLTIKVQRLMSKYVITLTEENTIDDVMRLMFVQGVHSIPVMKENKLIGIVGRRDLVEVL